MHGNGLGEKQSRPYGYAQRGVPGSKREEENYQEMEVEIDEIENDMDP